MKRLPTAACAGLILGGLVAPAAAEVLKAECNKQWITVSVSPRQAGAYRLEALTPYDSTKPLTVWTGRVSGLRQIRFARIKGQEDLLYRRFRLVHTASGRATSARYVTVFHGNSRGFRIPWPDSKKGLSCPVMVDDLPRLGVKHITYNMNLPGVLKDPNAVEPGEPVVTVDGERFGINVSALRHLDHMFKTMTDMGINIFLVINNPVPTSPDPNNPFIHPLTDLANAPTHLGAFNITNRKGMNAYRAVIGFFAERYSRPDCKYGWVSSYVVGNEVQAHWSWYNMGRPKDDLFLDEYMKALRVTDLILRDTHPDLRAYVSMEHHWTQPVDMRGDVALTGIAARARAEGDFPWDLAFHPYPESLFQPNFLKDTSATFRYDTPKITFKNLEVLTDFMRQPSMLYQGKMRRIALTEQGFHMPGGPEGQSLQAAAYAAAYYRVLRLDGIVAFNLHRHVSHKGEGGLKLGLYDWDVAGSAPVGRPFASYEAFRLSGTPEAESHLAHLLPVLGLQSWSELLPSIQIDRSKPKPLFDPKMLVVDLMSLVHTATLEHLRPGLEWRNELAYDGITHMPAIYTHPRGNEMGYGTMTVQLPKVARGERLLFTASTGFINDTLDGVRWEVKINGKVLESGEQLTRAFIPRSFDLTPWAGQRIELALGVHQRENPGADWFCWAKPAIVRQTGSRSR